MSNYTIGEARFEIVTPPDNPTPQLSNSLLDAVKAGAQPLQSNRK